MEKDKHLGLRIDSNTYNRDLNVIKLFSINFTYHVFWISYTNDKIIPNGYSAVHQERYSAELHFL